MRVKLWRYGPVEAYQLPLRDVDTLQAERVADMTQSAINGKSGRALCCAAPP